MPRAQRKVKIRKPYLNYFNPKKKKRAGAQILRDILYIARGGEKKTHILFGTNINPAILERYLKMAMEAGLITKNDRLYYTTPKGEEYIKEYERFQNLLKDLEQVERQIEKLLS